MNRTILKTDRGEFVYLLEGFFSPALACFHEVIYDMAHEMADEHMMWFYPRTEQATRTAYAGSDFKGFTDSMLNGQLEEAEALLLPLTKSTKNSRLESCLQYVHPL